MIEICMLKGMPDGVGQPDLLSMPIRMHCLLIKRSPFQRLEVASGRCLVVVDLKQLHSLPLRPYGEINELRKIRNASLEII